MTRVTGPRELARISRSLSTIAAPARPTILLAALRSASARFTKEVEQQDMPVSEQRTITTTTPHRPNPNPHRVIPLMQGFHTTGPTRYPQADTSSIDFAVLPTREMLSPPAVDDPFARLRVPLLPDIATPNRAAAPGHVPEAPDTPTPRPEIVVMAADPASVNVVSALTEVEGMGPDGVELSFAHDPDGIGAEAQGDAFASSMLRGIWAGLKEDVLGRPGI